MAPYGISAWRGWWILMILLDTNVISEPLRASPTPCVVAWIDGQPLETLCLSAITVAEMRAGIALLPAGKRQAFLRENLEERILPMFSGRVVPFDISCAGAYARLIAQTPTAGLAISAADTFIAAIALTNKFAVATRDIRPFTAAGVMVINPWDSVG